MQMCHRELDEKFFRPLASGEQLSANYVGEPMRGIRGVRGDDAELCNKLFPDTGDFMDPAEQRAIIRADFSDAEIARRLKKQKAYFKRLSRLLPALLGFLKKKPDTLIPILRIMDDFHHDYHYVANNKRRDKNKREMIDSLNKAANAVTTALSAIEKS